MSRSVLYMSMSLDGFITGPGDGPGNGLGKAGHLLHEWLGQPVSGRPTAMREAKAAAGDRDVMVHGADLAQSLLREGLLDELEIHLIPVVLGDGRRLFGEGRTKLELLRVLDAPGVTHLRYRVAT